MLIITVIIVIVLGIVYILSFNGLTSSRQDVKESWADIDVQLKRRQDLIPALIDSVKGYADYEKSMFEHIADTRSKAIALGSNDMTQKSTIEKELENNTHQLLALGENYPELKASENFQKLQAELTKTEDEIASARRIYNDNVSNYNTKVGVFPVNLIAVINHFEPASFFQNQ